MPTMWTLVKWLPWQQQLERLGSSSGVGRGARVRLWWGETGGGRWDTRTHAHLPPWLETPSHSGPQKPCSAWGPTWSQETRHIHSVPTPSRTGVSPHTAQHLRTLSVTNPRTSSPPGQTVTDTLSHWLTHTAAGNWGAHRHALPLAPAPLKEAVWAQPPGRPRGFRGWFYLQETRVFTMLYF